FTYNKVYRKITTLFFFYITNIVVFSFDFTDIIYSRFTQKRMTFDVFKFVGNEEGIVGLIPVFLRDYWYIFLLFLATVGLFIFVNSRLSDKQLANYPQFFVVRALPALIIFLALGFLTARGGFQLRPISSVNVSAHAMPRHYIYVTNTPFTLIKSIGKSALELKSYFTEKEADRLCYTIWHAAPGSQIDKRNIVILIMESFSAEHSKMLNPKLERSLTLNLDSIGGLGRMMLFYANGTRSMEGIPAIIAGLPTWMNGEYITSPYADNKITALPALLKKQGYSSAFYHGGQNGTMNLLPFTQLAGFERYFGRSEYGNDTHFDGSWGIFDDYYLPYTAREMSKLDTPFLATVFSLSSHHPFYLPDHYRKMYPKKAGKSMPESIEYADWALGKFFAEAARQPWFDNTIFIITADHAACSTDPYYQTCHARYTIPLVIFDPKQQIDTICKPFGQQIDILPTILEMIQFPNDYFAFGKSLFNDHPPYAVNFLNGIYQMITESHILLFNGMELTGYYDRREDPFMENDLKETVNDDNYELLLLKSIIQQYNRDLILNRLTIE
ncbi:MAG: LTA synthase family protein, partial [Bacteroidales bacterium]|nr:LTA synthase family protein [Bacteroidales bacterium]